MRRIIVNRLGYMLVLLCGICLINFFLFHLSPGDPTNRYFGPKVKRENLQALRQQMGVDQPWYVQLGQWSSRISRCDLGYSWAKHQPVAALFINLLVGCSIGILSGMYYQRWYSKLIDIASLALYAMPVF